MLKVAIGAPTYNSAERLRDLFTTMSVFTDYPEDQYKLVMLDDGTPDANKVKQLESFSQESGIPLIKNKVNRGIPYSWNRLTEFYDAEYVVLFNDDIQIQNDKWLYDLVYFLDNNPNSGACGFPLIHIDPKTGKRNMTLSLPDESGTPGRVGSPVGCAFGFRKYLWKNIRNADGTIGFWEDLVSFYEELSFGFELAKMGFSSYQLPTPAVEHWGSVTFGSNRELATRVMSGYLPKEEYLAILRANTGKLALPIEQHEELASQNKAYRMDYARVLFAKKWECEDKVLNPQSEVHTRHVDTLPKEAVRWLDQSGRRQEVII